MRILIAPACFKGSLGAAEVAGIAAELLQAHLPEAELDVCPVADGGDDTLAVLALSDPGFVWRSAMVTGPLPDQTVEARYLVHPERKLAVLEAAQAHGYQLLPGGKLCPMTATSYGVGELLKIAAGEAGIETIVITVGGSASTDGGLGALQALGVRFVHGGGKVLEAPIGGGLLSQIHKIKPPDWYELWPFTGQVLIATDVVNPLCGPEGAAQVFGPQKGATQAQCNELDTELSRLSGLLHGLSGVDYSGMPGVGAAGGLAYGLRHLPRSGIISGSQWVADQLDLQTRIRRADLILSGEGCLDTTSFAGKATGNILAWAGTQPVIMICGQVQKSLSFPPSVQVFSLSEALGPEEAFRHPADALRRTLEAAVAQIPLG